MEYLYPFNNFFEAFSFAFLSLQFDLRFEKDLLVEIFNNEFRHSLKEEHVDALIQKFMFLLKTDFSNIKHCFNNLQEKLSNRKRIITPPIEFCLTCQKCLDTYQKKEKISFTRNGSFQFVFISFNCMKCGKVYEADRYSIKNKTFFYPNEINEKTEFISLSSQTAFEIKLIENLSINIAVNAISFKGKFKKSKKNLFTIYL